MADLVIYHGGCTDGVAAACAAYQQLPKATYWPGVYQDDPPWELVEAVQPGERLYCLDFSYKRPVMEEIAARCAGECWILDHHKTAMDDCAELLTAPELNRWRGEFDMDRCGALMAWDHFNGAGTRPWLLEHIDARDRWLEQRPAKNDAVTFALRTLPHAASESCPMDLLMSMWRVAMSEGARQSMITDGEAIHAYYRTLVEQAKTWACEWHLGDAVMPVANAPYFLASEVAGELAEEHESGCAAVYWIDAGTGFATFSLRARKGADVSELAKQFGGGGHPGAAGFRVPLVNFHPTMKFVARHLEDEQP